MKATPEQQRVLLEIGGLDFELDRHNRAVADVKSGKAQAELRGALLAATEAVVAARNALDESDLELSRAESDLKVVEARIAKDNAQLRATSVPSIATGIQHELQTLAGRKSDLEDLQLSVLERREGLERELSACEQTRAEIESQLNASLADARQELLRLESGISLLLEKRAGLQSEVPADVLAAYDRKHSRGTGVGTLQGRDCSACQMGLDAVALSKLGALAPDELGECAECGAFLVR